MSFDNVLTEVREFGPYQKRIYALLTLPWIVHSPFMFISVFILATPDYRCKIPGYQNDSYHVTDDSHKAAIDKYIPLDTSGINEYDRCHVISYSQNTTHLVECSSWVYSNELFYSTLASDMDLVCDDKYKTSLSKTIFFAGVFVGSFGFGLLSDLIGRKKTLFTAIFLLSASAFSMVASPSYLVFVCLRFCVGVCNVGVFMTAYVTCMEWVGPSKRSWAGLVIACFGPFGEMYLVLMSFLLRDWRYIIIAMATPVALTFILWWFIPESPRWLASRGRLKEAKVILQRAAEVNETKVPEKVDVMVENTSEKQETGRLWLLLSTKPLLKRSFIIFYNWMVVSMTFYGLSLNVGNLYGNIYVNYVISVLVEFPGHIVPLFVIDRYGRKKSHIFFMLFGGIACLLTIFPVTFGGKDIQAVTTALAMVGKCGATAAFATIYVFAAELFPTVVRNAGMGASSCCARIGGMISPFIADLSGIVGGSSGKAIPLVIFGGASVVAGLLTLILPETFGTTLPETIEDGKTFGKGGKEFQLLCRPMSFIHKKDIEGDPERADIDMEGELKKYASILKGYQPRWVILDHKQGVLKYYMREGMITNKNTNTQIHKFSALCNLQNGVMEWRHGVEWSGVEWSGLDSTL
ncbi:hypothetical protein FSP39_021403 [Pinctada imbricata]|uniref:Major facilitator superfamily (MFS) profile domain-containing protein n=1 Tax=Pinctada imbricata TaxID=66713 RepID=A0AA88YCA8_PINIB|nr:hypothetical protein FSP39_021403 [Pinctada imbricata]